MNTNQTFTNLFWLFKAKMRNDKAPIYCRITINGKRAQFSLKRSIDPKKWNSSSGRAKGNSEEARILNTYLNKVQNELLKHFNLLEAKDEIITADTIKNSYLGIKEKERSLIETFQYHNDQMKELIGIDVVKSIRNQKYKLKLTKSFLMRLIRFHLQVPSCFCYRKLRMLQTEMMAQRNVWLLIDYLS